MIYLIYGAVGVMTVLLLFSGGVFAGWKLHVMYETHMKHETAEAVTEEERRRVIEDNKAFTDLLGYNIDMAYGNVSRIEDLAAER